MIREIDQNNNGTIDFNQFVLIMVKQENPDKSKAPETTTEEKTSE
jgi:Ca2+-binding EF-hand superfamily protein